MRAMKQCGILLAVGMAVSASASEVERYRHFATEGIFDKTMSNEAVHERVRAGIASDDAEVVEWTIKAVGQLSQKFGFGLPNPLGGPLPSRSVGDIPGLKEFLINHWQEQHELSGHDTRQAIDESLGLRDGQTLADLTLSDKDVAVGTVERHEDWGAVIAERVPAWVTIPRTLCEFWPGDPDVHRLLLRDYALDASEDVATSTLLLLNAGRFVTPEAYELRIGQLNLPAEDWRAAHTVRLAVAGLALSRPPEALPHLIAAGERHRSVRGDILVVLADYGDDELGPYSRELRALLGDSRPDPTMMLAAEAFDRLQALVGGAVRSDP